MVVSSAFLAGEETLRTWIRRACAPDIRRRAETLAGWADRLPPGQPVADRALLSRARPSFADPPEDPDTQLMADTLIILARTRGIPVTMVNVRSLGPAGWVDLHSPDEIEIFLSRSLQPAECAVTIAHELAHVELGHAWRHISYHREEIEADLAAALLASAFEIDASQPTIDLIALHLHYEPDLLSFQTSIVHRAIHVAAGLFAAACALKPTSTVEPGI